MTITIFENKGNVCYSTSKSRELSMRSQVLISKGWRFVGYFCGKDISSSGIPTMTKILKKGGEKV